MRRILFIPDPNPILRSPAKKYHSKDSCFSHLRRIRGSVKAYGNLLKFALSSLSSFVLDYGLFTVFALLLPHTTLFALAANVGARLISGLYNYLVNCRLVFHERGGFGTALDYVALALFILVMNQIILGASLEFLHFPLYAAKLFTELSLFLISWTVQRFVIFRRSLEAQPPASEKLR